MLVLMKSRGCWPISLIRYFNETIESSKVKRKINRNTNYYVPMLSEERKQVNCIALLLLSYLILLT